MLTSCGENSIRQNVNVLKLTKLKITILCAVLLFWNQEIKMSRSVDKWHFTNQTELSAMNGISIMCPHLQRTLSVHQRESRSAQVRFFTVNDTNALAAEHVWKIVAGRLTDGLLLVCAAPTICGFPSHLQSLSACTHASMTHHPVYPNPSRSTCLAAVAPEAAVCWEDCSAVPTSWWRGVKLMI